MLQSRAQQTVSGPLVFVWHRKLNDVSFLKGMQLVKSTSQEIRNWKDDALLETIFYSENNYTLWTWKLLHPVTKYHNLEASNELISIHISLGSQIYEHLVHFAIDKAYDHKYSLLRLDCACLLFLLDILVSK